MAVTDRQPDNTNYLSPLGFRFMLNRTPNTNYFVQNVVLPSISLANFDVQNPFVALPTPGTKLSYEALTLTFMVNEDMDNYLEIYNWLVGMGFPESYDQYDDFVDRRNRMNKTATPEFSDGTLILLSSHQNANLKVTFEDMFPVSLSDLNFDSTLTDVEYLRATVTFRYKLYTVQKM